jgi:BirA family transcriptional regulator, biotin operon repressor / biotin---[acetyl-CoA-carboxylase] ligase
MDLHREEEKITEQITKEGICKYTQIPTLYVYEEIDSTNEELKRLFRQAEKEKCRNGSLAVANHQTAGKGRLGRYFYSPSQTGIYMSVLLELGLDFAESVLVTTAASVAVCRAIQEVCGISCGIKWVNDIYLKDRKICGILTEAVTDASSGRISAMICGIGINVSTGDFPEEAGKLAASLYEKDTEAMPEDILNRLTAAVYRHLMQICMKLPDKSYMAEYRDRSVVLGRPIRYTDHGEWVNARVTGIDEDGGLEVLSERDGQITLSSGEITIRVREEEKDA